MADTVQLQQSKDAMIRHLDKYGEISFDIVEKLFKLDTTNDMETYHRFIILYVQSHLVNQRVLICIPEEEKYVLASWMKLFPIFVNGSTLGIFYRPIKDLSELKYKNCRSYISKSVFSHNNNKPTVQTALLNSYSCAL